MTTQVPTVPELNALGRAVGREVELSQGLYVQYVHITPLSDLANGAEITIMVQKGAEMEAAMRVAAAAALKSLSKYAPKKARTRKTEIQADGDDGDDLTSDTQEAGKKLLAARIQY